MLQPRFCTQLRFTTNTFFRHKFLQKSIQWNGYPRHATMHEHFVQTKSVQILLLPTVQKKLQRKNCNALFKNFSSLSATPKLKCSQQEALHNSIVHYPWEKLTLKKNFFQPRQLSTNTAGFHREGRYTEQKQVYDAFCTRLQNRKNFRIPEDRQNNPLPAVHGSPGSGKSFFLDVIGQLNEKDLLDMCQNDEMRDILKSSVAVSVTFNAGTQFENTVDGKDAEAGLAIRILHSFYFNSGSWTELANACVQNLTVEAALDCILFAIKKKDPSKQGVLLLVDELLKSSNATYPRNIDMVLHSIGGELHRRTSKEFNLLVSTLDVNPLESLKTASGRCTSWTLLNSLTYEESLALFSDQQPKCNKIALHQCISDCNGHPRSLETLKLLCDKEKWILPTYPFLRKGLRLLLASEAIPVPMLPHVVAALRGEEMYLDAQVPGWSGTFRDAIVQGYLHNAMQPELATITPKLSPLLLMTFADTDRNHPIAKCILDMLDLETNFSWKVFVTCATADTCKCYEHFHAKWEVIRRLIANPGERVSLVDYSLLSESTSLPSFLLTPKEILKLQHHIPGPTKTEAEQLNSIIIPADGNPAFDIVSFESGKVIAIECRNSIPHTTTTLHLKEIKSKRTYIEKHLTDSKSAIGKLGLSKNDIFFVVCAWRNQATDIEKKLLAKLTNCIVLGKPELTNLYSPTLSSRPQFILESTPEGPANLQIPSEPEEKISKITKKPITKGIGNQLYTKEELVKYCKENGLKVSGKKEELTERILQYSGGKNRS